MDILRENKPTKQMNVQRCRRCFTNAMNNEHAQLLPRVSIGVGDGGQGALPPPKKKHRENIFRATTMQNSAIFSGKNRVKFDNFVNFSGKNHVKFGHFVIFSYIFFGEK